MADSAILAAGGDDAPLTYTVPGAAVIRIKQVHVAYEDNGAGADWLPMVRIVSDSGHTMGQAADQAVKVTAGSAAAVTFHPGVKHATAAGAAAGLPFANVELAAVATPLAAGNYAPNIQTLTTNTPGAAIFSVDPLQPTFLQIAEAGLYCLGVVWHTSSPATLPVNGFITVNQAGGSLTGSTPIPIAEYANTVATKRVQDLNGIAYSQFAGPDSVRFIYHTGQSMVNVGPLGWTCWQVSKSITA